MGNEVLVTWLQKENLWVSNNGCTEEVKYITMQFKKYKIYLRSDVFVIKFFITVIRNLHCVWQVSYILRNSFNSYLQLLFLCLICY